MSIRTILDAFRSWGWSLSYLTRQKRSEPRLYARMGRFRESSQLRMHDENQDCCFYFQNLGEQCPLHHTPKPIMDESGFGSGAGY